MPLGRTRMLLAAAGTLALFSMCLNMQLANATQSNEAAKSAVAMSDASKVTQLILPVKDNGFKLGDVIIWANTDGSVFVQKDSLLTAIRDALRGAALREFEAKLPPEANITLGSINMAGIKCSYNPSDLEIQIEPTVEQRPRGEVTGTTRGNNAPSNLTQPGALSGFLNMRFGAAYQRYEDSDGLFDFPAILFEALCAGMASCSREKPRSVWMARSRGATRASSMISRRRPFGSPQEIFLSARTTHSPYPRCWEWRYRSLTRIFSHRRISAQRADDPFALSALPTLA